MVSVNPHNTDETESRAVAKASIRQGYVSDYDTEKNTIEIQPIGEGKETGAALSTTMTATVSSNGDIAIPDSDEDSALYAIYARVDNGTPYVLGFYYDDKTHTIPQANAGERKLGHQATDSEIYFRKDGSLLIESDSGATIELTASGETIINGGTKGVIHDVSTTTDADGHVTSISLSRRSDILI